MASNTQTITPPTGVPPELTGFECLSQGLNPVTLAQSRIMLGSLPGRGKSTLVHGCPTTLVLDVENSGPTVARPRCLRFGPKRDRATGATVTPPITEYRKLVDKMIQLRKAGKTPIETIAIDTVDAMLNQFARELCKERGVESLGDCERQGMGYVRQRDFLFNMIEDIYDAGFGWVTICHVGPRTVRTDKGEVITYGFLLPEKVREYLFGRCEHQIFIDEQEIPVMTTKKLANGNTYEAQVGTRKSRVLVPKPGNLKYRPGHGIEEAKCRVPLPDEIPISEENGWQELEVAYDQAILKLEASNAKA